MLNNVILFLCFSLVLCLPVQAENIRLKSGQTVSAKLLKEETDSILVDAGIGTPVTYFRDEIIEILPDDVAKPVVLAGPQADALEAKGLEFIDADKMDQGLNMIKQAIELDPTPIRYMNYGSILFGNGVELFKKGQIDDAKKTLKACEEQLQKAIAGFDKTKDNAFLAQSYFLLGEMHNNAFADPLKAKTYYERALSYFDHDGAKAALAKLPQ